MRDGEPGLAGRIRSLDGPTFISIITRVELEGGVFSDPALATARRTRLDLTLPGLPSIVFDNEAAEAYGRILKPRASRGVAFWTG